MRALCVNQVELINQRCESIAVVDDIAAVVLARDRAFECQLLGYGTHLQDVLVAAVLVILCRGTQCAAKSCDQVRIGADVQRVYAARERIQLRQSSIPAACARAIQPDRQRR